MPLPDINGFEQLLLELPDCQLTLETKNSERLYAISSSWIACDFPECSGFSPGSGKSVSDCLMSDPDHRRQRIFLLSPANLAGIRARYLFRPEAEFDLACRLRRSGVTLGELFSFVSGLYFRGKLAYSRAFSAPPPGVSGSLVITAAGGLLTPETVVTLDRLRELAANDIDPSDDRYRLPLDRDCCLLSDRIADSCEVILLGSVATPKYVEPLLQIFRERLLFPAEFVGRGDMSRGGLMLRSVESGKELSYVPVLNATRHGLRPPKLSRFIARGNERPNLEGPPRGAK
jgi:hypothetical protein